jgi:acylphosphatase
MVQARYLISDKVINVGLRVFLTSFMMDEGIKKGVARNIDKKTVEMLVDLGNTNAEEFHKKVETAIHTEFESADTGCDRGKINVKLAETSNPGWDIPDIMFSSQSLLLNQTGKGVNVMLRIEKGINDLPEKLARAIKGK